MQIKALATPAIPFTSRPVHVKEGQAQEDQWKVARMSVKKAKKYARLIGDRPSITRKTLILSNIPSQKEKEGLKYFNHFSKLREDEGGSDNLTRHSTHAQMEEDEVEEFVPLSL